MTTEDDAGERPGDEPKALRDAALAQAAGATPRVVSSDKLLRGASQLAILHRQDLYFLRETRFGKLILTK
jgi:hemin uptake protein HemP